MLCQHISVDKIVDILSFFLTFLAKNLSTTKYSIKKGIETFQLAVGGLGGINNKKITHILLYKN